MKQTKITFWVSTVLIAGFMIVSSFGGAIGQPEAVNFIVGLGFPAYFVPFISIAKILGSIALLVPGYYRIKEWAYAGLMFDMVGATYAVTAKAGPSGIMFGMMAVLIAVTLVSYFSWHKMYRRA